MKWDFVRQWFWLLPLTLIAGQQLFTFNKHSENFADIESYTQQYAGKDFISNYEKRFPELQQYFASPAHLGYVSETGQNKSTYYLHYVLTQYNLAPNLISTSTESDTILYNLYTSMHLDPETNHHLLNGWHIIKDFNNGFILISK